MSLNTEKYVKYLRRQMRRSIRPAVGAFDNLSNWDELIGSMLLYRKLVKTRRYIFRSECQGKWVGGFYKKIDKYYFKFPWYFYKPLYSNASQSKKYAKLYQMTELRKLMYPKATRDDLIYCMLVDIFCLHLIGPIDGFSYKSVYSIVSHVMRTPFEGLIGKNKELLEKLMDTTKPKSGIIFNTRKYPQFRKASGTSKGRALVRFLKFSELYDKTKNSKENLEYFKKKGLDISYKTFLKYRKHYIEIEENNKFDYDLAYITRLRGLRKTCR